MTDPLQPLKEKIRRFIQEDILESAVDDLDDDTALVSGGLVNSLSTLRLVTFLEDTFDIEFPAHEISVDNLDSVGRIAECVKEKQDA